MTKLIAFDLVGVLVKNIELSLEEENMEECFETI